MRGAVRDGYIRKTPCVEIRLPETSATVVRLLTPGQVLALASMMPTRYALLVLVGAGLGLRQGEAFGLALDRIDAATGMITVDQQVVIVDRRPVLAPPKTSASFRDVPMPRFVLDAVTEHVKQFALGDCDVLCRTPRGTLLRRDYYKQRDLEACHHGGRTRRGHHVPRSTTYVCQHGTRRGRPDLGSLPLAGT